MTKLYHCPSCKRSDEIPLQYVTIEGITIGPMCPDCVTVKIPRMAQFFEAKNS